MRSQTARLKKALKSSATVYAAIILAQALLLAPENFGFFHFLISLAPLPLAGLAWLALSRQRIPVELDKDDKN